MPPSSASLRKPNPTHKTLGRVTNTTDTTPHDHDQNELGVFVPVGEPGSDVAFEGLDGAVDTPAEPLVGQFAEPSLHQVQPRWAGGREVQTMNGCDCGRTYLSPGQRGWALEDAPKSVAGFRTVPLTPQAADVVRTTAVDRWRPPRTVTPIGEDPYNLVPEEPVFRGPQGRALTRHNFRRVWVPAIEAAGIARKVKNRETGHIEWWPQVHDWRHLFATWLEDMGIDEKDTQTPPRPEVERMGEGRRGQSKRRGGARTDTGAAPPLRTACSGGRDSPHVDFLNALRTGLLRIDPLQV